MRRYTTTAISLHWLLALLIIAALSLGLYMSDLPLSPTKLRLYSYHKWLGVTVFGLLWLRLAWRLSHTPPAGIGPRWQQRAAEVAHWGLYALMLAMPLSGWLYSSASGYQTVYLGLWPIPNALGKDKALAELLHELHELLGYAFMALIALHVAAALKHHFIDKDGLLRRMWF